MFSLFSQIGNLVESIVTIIRLLFWVIGGIDDVISLLNTALNSIIDMINIFPEVVGYAFMGVCGGLFVLRIFGRS